jgi:MerR family mercuric resistance operon transcriptional regulator
MSAIGRASAASGLSADTIRFYERTGLLPRPARGAGGRRDYGAQDIARLRFVRRCRDLGFPIAGIANLLALAEARDRDCAEVRAVASAHLDALRRRRAELDALEAALSRLLDGCDDGDGGCVLLERLLG